MKALAKPVKVSNGEFLTGSNFEPVLMTPNQVIALAKQTEKRLNAGCTKFGCFDAGDYYRATACTTGVKSWSAR